MSKHSNWIRALLTTGDTTFVRQSLVLVCILTPLVLLVAWRMPVTYPEGDFVMNVMDVAKTGHVSSTFTPDRYAYLVGLAHKAGGVRGPFVDAGDRISSACLVCTLAASFTYLFFTFGFRPYGGCRRMP